MAKICDYTIKIENVGENVQIKTNEDGTISMSMTMLNDDTPHLKIEKGDDFIRINVEELHTYDDWLFYTPKTEKQKNFKARISEILEKGNIKNFFIPLDYCNLKFFNSSLKELHVGTNSCESWISSAKSHGSNMLTYSRYNLILAVMLKCLTENGYDANTSWSLICDDSRPLQDLDWVNIFGFKNFMGYQKFLLPDDESDEGCYMSYGGLEYYSYLEPLADIVHNRRRDVSLEDCPFLCYGSEFKE